MGRKAKRIGWGWRLIGIVLLTLALAAAWLWWDTQRWAPAEDLYQVQGALVDDASGDVNFEMLRALGSDFVYLQASDGQSGHDREFAAHMADARAADLKVGAVHIFDPCVRADAQSANFSVVVPRDRNLLPPAIALSRTGAACEDPVSDAAVESELMTLINQVEMHEGQPAILKLSSAFEDHYGIAAKMDRNIWLESTRLEPRYGGRPWVLWSANMARQVQAAEEPIEWLVLRP